MSSHDYQLYGLRLSSNEPLRFLQRQQPTGRYDVKVEFVEGSLRTVLGSDDWPFWHVSGACDGHGRPCVTIRRHPDGERFHWAYLDGVEFLVASSGRKVQVARATHSSIDDAVSYLTGAVFGFLLRLRGTICLHASAVTLDGAAVALLGASGAGKSTSAGAFARRGFAVITDDVLPLAWREGGVFASPGYPRLKLWSDAVPALNEMESALPPLPDTPPDLRLHLPLTQHGYRCEALPRPLATIYLLGDRQPGLTRLVLERMTETEAFVALVANTSANQILDERMRAAEFRQLGHLVRDIPVLRVRLPEGPASLSGLCDTLLSDFRARSFDAESVSAAPSAR